MVPDVRGEARVVRRGGPPVGCRSSIVRRVGWWAAALGSALAGACGGGSVARTGPGTSNDAGTDASGAIPSGDAGAQLDGGSPDGGETVGADAHADASSDGGGLNPGLPPGSNFNLSSWELQEPVGAAGSPTTISNTALESGFHDSYFYTDPNDGAMTFWDPENGVTTANSDYPRSELRELDADGTLANWAVAGQNVLTATLAVTLVPDHVCIGQIHIGSALQSGLAASTKPLLELFYYANGTLRVAIESDPVSGTEAQTTVGTVPLGAMVAYTIGLTGDGTGGGTLSITVNGAESTFPMPSGFVGYGEYFKAGDYDQSSGTDATVGATVKFYSLRIAHGT